MPLPTSLVDAREEALALRQRLKRIFDEAGPNMDMELVKSLTGTSEDKVAEIRRLNEELNAVAFQEERLSTADMIRQSNEEKLRYLTEPVGGFTHPGGSGNGLGAAKAFGPRELRYALQASKDYQRFRDGTSKSVVLDFPAVDFKTLISLSDINRQADLMPGVVPGPTEDRTVSDLMLQGNTTANTIEYYERTSFTNNADTVAEGGTKPESALGYTLRTDSVRKIGHWIPATKESLDDVPFLESEIRGELSYGVVRSEEEQLLFGNGTAPNIRGLMNRAGLQSYAKTGGDSVADAIYHAMQLVRGEEGDGFAEPTAIVMHPTDYTGYRLMRTTDGIYINGSPSEPGPDRMWGLMVRQTTAMSQGTALTGAFRPYSKILRREGITITLSTEHSTFFIENKVAILAEERIALQVTRGSAFATATGL